MDEDYDAKEILLFRAVLSAMRINENMKRESTQDQRLDIHQDNVGQAASAFGELLLGTSPLCAMIQHAF